MEGNLKFLLQQPQRPLNKNIKVVNHKLHSNISSDKSNKFETFFQEQQQAKEGKPCF